MGYTKLIGIEVDHEYFGDNFFSAFKIVADKETKKLLHNYGLQVKKRPKGIYIAWDKENEAFSTLNVEDQKIFKLSFYLEISDPFFQNYTQLDSNTPNGVFCFSNAGTEGADHRYFLGRSQYASLEDYCILAGDSFMYEREDSGSAETYTIVNHLGESVSEIQITENQKKVPLKLTDLPNGVYALRKQENDLLNFYKDASLFWKPVFGVIELYPFDETTGITDLLNGTISGFTTYILSFKARSTIWRYYIIPKHRSGVDDVKISNGRNGGPISFIKKGHQRLSDGSEAVVFDSESAIRLEQSTVNMYQLKSGTGTTLINALPTPSVNFINAKKEHNQQHFYSEMYVYL
ncbi:MAG: hypothetical protein FH748_15100 [Balneolaceae bacterium]|nr:hypothetical protein [Balneolaceae bacterium]